MLNSQRSTELFAEAQTLFPGGVDSPVRAFRAVGGQPLFIAQRRQAAEEVTPHENVEQHALPTQSVTPQFHLAVGCDVQMRRAVARVVDRSSGRAATLAEESVDP